jgi:hypothetical protein
MGKKLRTSEILALLTSIVVLFTICLIAFLQKRAVGEPPLCARNLADRSKGMICFSKPTPEQRKATRRRSRGRCLVSVVGSVRKPGAYEVNTGTAVIDVIRKAKPLRDADLRSWRGRAIDQSGTVEIQSLKMLEIEIGGAVAQPQRITVPLGTRICDLKRVVQVAPQADRQFLRRKKRLKDGDTVHIPFKKGFIAARPSDSN